MTAFARATDPLTSHQAAESVQNISATQSAILNLLQINSMTDEDLVYFYKQQIAIGADRRDFPLASESGLRSRRADLVKMGLVKDSGERVRLVSGRNAIVWQA